MEWLCRFRRKIGLLFEEKMKFILIEIVEISWEISLSVVHTIIQDTYLIYVNYKKESYDGFLNFLKNRESLPSIKLAETARPK